MFEAAPVQGTWRRLTSPDDVLALMDTSAEGVVACVADAGATFSREIRVAARGDHTLVLDDATRLRLTRGRRRDLEALIETAAG